MTTSSRPGPASDPSTRVASQRKDELDVNSRRCRTGYCTTCVARALAHEPRGCPSGHFRARAWPRHPGIEGVYDRTRTTTRRPTRCSGWPRWSRTRRRQRGGATTARSVPCRKRSRRKRANSRRPRYEMRWIVLRQHAARSGKLPQPAWINLTHRQAGRQQIRMMLRS